MPIIEFQPPQMGRSPRLSDEELESIAQKIRAGKWASDGIAVAAKSCAYQRAQTAVKLLQKRFGLYVAYNELQAIKDAQVRAAHIEELRSRHARDFDFLFLKTHASPVDRKITPLDTRREKVLKTIKCTEEATKVQTLQQEAETLRQQIADMGGYHWAVGPDPAPVLA